MPYFKRESKDNTIPDNKGKGQEGSLPFSFSGQEIITTKAKEIFPLLNGFTLSQIEFVLDEILEMSKLRPITTPSHP